MLRAIALSLALLIGIGAIVPLTTNYTEAKRHSHRKHKKRHWKGVKKYSKRWWQLYHRQQRRKKARAAYRRSLRLRQIRLANRRRAVVNGSTAQNNSSKSNQKSVVESATPAMLPSGDKAPKGWQRGQVAGNELQYRVEDDNGAQLGSASIAVVGPALEDGVNSRNKSVGGVSTSSLRRTVIDKMIKEEGWVVNDYQKEIGGKKVFVVVAQSPGSDNRVQSRLFYFTEVNGKIYSVAMNAPVDNSRRLEEESEKVVSSLQRGSVMAQKAELK